MDKEQRCAAKAQLVTGMQAGHSWQTAAAQAGLQIIQSNAIGFGEPSGSMVRWRWKMDGTVISANCVERPIPF